MVTLEEYFGNFFSHPDATPERKLNAAKLLSSCGNLQTLALQAGITFKVNPVTHSLVSGTQYGGFRPKACPQGAEHSSHKEGLAIDLYDPTGAIDAWCLSNAEVNGKLESCGIYIEHPNSTDGWSHWTIRAPNSGHRVFFP